MPQGLLTGSKSWGALNMKTVCKICNNTAHVIENKEYFCADCMMKIIKRKIPYNSKPVFKKVLPKTN